jgi:hypothetical protein
MQHIASDLIWELWLDLVFSDDGPPDFSTRLTLVGKLMSEADASRMAHAREATTGADDRPCRAPDHMRCRMTLQ